MEVQRYLELLRRRWLIVVTATLITSLLTAVLVSGQPSVYESKGTFLMRPATENSEDVVRALDTLIRGVEITSTYATIASSSAIRERAEERVGPGVDTSGTTVSGSVVTGTNVVELSVTGPDPQAVHSLANAVGKELQAYTADTQSVYQLQPLDIPELANEPVGPKRGLSMFLGVVFGFGLGALLAVLAEGWLGRRTEAEDAPPPVVERAGSDGRFADELMSALRSQRPFSMAVLTISDDGWRPDSRGIDHRQIEDLARERLPSLRPDDVVGYLGELTFALMLPNTSPGDAEELMRSWIANMVWASDDRQVSIRGLRAKVGVFQFGTSVDREVGGPRVVAMHDRFQTRQLSPKTSGGLE